MRSDGGFDHNTETDFALDGQHTPLACLSCHEELRFDLVKATTEECETCHANPHTLALSSDCASCHSSASFTEVPFEQAHWNVRFELLGVHETVACETCHEFPSLALQEGVVAVEAESCLSCHRSDYDEGHGARFPDTCLDCHSQTTWDDVFFDHTVVSEGFELVGSHELAACESCHTTPGYGLLFSPAPSSNEDCLTCHQSDYDTEHGGGFPTTCLTCHNQTTWSGATFNHSDLSDGFELIGAHEVADCASCHSEPGYELLFSPAPSSNDDCLTCHQSDFDSEHGGSGFPTTCLSCHNQVTWEGATFSHPEVSNGFELIGAHQVATCESCHSVPGYDLLFSPAPSGNDDCITCHQSDYNSEHSGTGFPTTCLTCHNQTTWDGATFDHDALFFPIYSGEHRGEWNQCADCHRQAPITYATFSCIDCHEHRQSEMDDEHRGINGYVWDSLACLSCHPDGRE